MNATTDPAGVTERITLLGTPGLLGLLLSRCGSSMGAQILTVAVGWQLYALTHRAWALGLLGLVQFLPMALLILVAGDVADRFDRRRIASVCQCVELGVAVGLCAGSASHALTPALIYALAALLGAARAFEAPTMQALLPSLVPGSLFPRAAALNASAFQTVTIIGPSLGGLLYGVGAAIPYGLSACLFAGAACCVGLLVPAPAIAASRRQGVSLEAIFGGIRFIRERPAILGAISLDLFAVLLGGATALLPVYASDILHAGPFGLGLLRAAPALGALAVSVWLARRPIGGRAGPKMFAAVAVFGFATIAFGLSRSLPLSIVALAVLGASDVISVVVRSSLVQLQTPDAMRGRVSAVNMLFIGTSNQLGEFESGTLAALIGAVPAVVAGGIGTVLVALLWMRLFPTLRRLDRLDAK